jgi:hypothetical protein
MIKSVAVLLLVGFSTLLAKGNSRIDSTSFPAKQTTIVTKQRAFESLPAPPLPVENDPIIVPYYLLNDSTAYDRAIAQQLQQEVISRNAFINSLNELGSVELPVGISPKNGDVNYAIIISKVQITDFGAFVDAYLMLEIPQADSIKIAFKGKNIRFSHEGGLTGEGRLELVGSYPIALNDNTLLTILGNRGNTFVDFDCNGFKGMGLEAEVEFSRNIIIPEDEKGKLIPGTDRVKTRFTTYAQSWNDLLVGINLPPFQINGLSGFGFQVTEAYLDWSDLANPSGMVFPAGYTSPFLSSEGSTQSGPSTEGSTQSGLSTEALAQNGSPTEALAQVGNLWQGIYLQKLEVRLPPSFKTSNDSTRRVKVGVERMLLDERGFSGSIFAENIFEAGDMSGWSYTLDKLAIELVINDIKGFELAGKLSVPLVKNKEGNASRFGYNAQRGANGNYLFAVSIEDQLRLPLLLADLTVHQGSSVTVVEKNNKFYPTLLLNGQLGIKGTDPGSYRGGPKPELLGIRFEGMRISTQEPRFDIQALGFGRENQQQQVSKFPVSINNISVKKEQNRLGLGFDLIVNIGGGAADEGFGGTAALTVWGKRGEEPIKNAEGQVVGTDKGAWKFDKVELSGVGLSIKKPGVIELAGTVTLFDADPIYGEGFKGSLTGKIQTITVKADALFGKTPAFRYWYADALVEIETGIVMVPGVLSAYGFGGGYYSKMKQSATGSALGRAQSGLTYVPDENTNGIRAIVLIGAARKEAWSGDVALEVALNRHGGINSVTFTGNANFMTPPILGASKITELAALSANNKLAAKLASLLKGQVCANVKIHFDNVNDVFHANAEVYVNVAGGLVRGVSDGNKAGWFVMHFEKNDWYVHIGTPNQPLGIEVARIFKSKSYFMLGKNLPGSPPPPSQVTEILGPVDLDYMRDMNALQSGTGFAYGMQFIVDTGDLRFLMFYGRFAAGTGVDFMLKNYGEGYHCEGSSGPIGINGWYANGQAYAFVMGKIGVRVNLRFYKGNYDILTIGAAAVLQAKGPNPFWMKGVVGGDYRILGGLVKGNCKFDVTVGKDCKPVGEQNLLADVNMIAEISPVKGASEVDVFVAPQATFSIPIGKTFNITDAEDKKHIYRANLKEFSLYEGTKPLTGNVRWNEERDVAIFDASDILFPKKDHRIKVVVAFEELVKGTWSVVTYDGKKSEETEEAKFKSGEAPDYIPANLVEYSYPIAGQYNFYPAEYGKGFIRLKKGIPHLFQAGSKWLQKARFTEVGTNKATDLDYKYDVGKKEVTYSIPSGLSKEKNYQFELVNIPSTITTSVDKNVKRSDKQIGNAASGEMTVSTKSIEGQVSILEAKSIYSLDLRTSKYSTFTEKWNALNLSNTYTRSEEINVWQLVSNIRGGEFFDNMELLGDHSSEPLVRFEADLTGNAWYEQKVYPLVYEGLPLLNRYTISRPVNPLGLPPVRSVFVNQQNAYGSASLNNSTAPIAYTGWCEVVYNTMPSMYIDYQDIQHKIANHVIDNSGAADERMLRLLLTPFPVLLPGSYKVNASYKIPGVENKTSILPFSLTPEIR